MTATTAGFQPPGQYAELQSKEATATATLKAMVSTLTVQLNGQARTLDNARDPSTLDIVIQALDLKSDRVAVELNGDIVRRSTWAETPVRSGDRLEIVHFVGGGS